MIWLCSGPLPEHSHVVSLLYHCQTTWPFGTVMELRHLRYFVAVAELRSVRAASEQLHVTQPAISRQIRDLEDAIGAAGLNDANGHQQRRAGDFDSSLGFRKLHGQSTR